jgi:putative membrane protein
MNATKLLAGVALATLSFAAFSATGQEETDTSLAAQQFADAAASSNMFEIRSSELAIDRASNEDVKLFAQQMITDHTAASEKLMAAAQQDGITPSDQMAPHHQNMLDGLTSADGEASDAAYVEAQVAAHEEAVALFEAYVADGPEGALKAFATETLPTLILHHEHVSALAGSD